jgi:hypothetical protein
LVGAVLRWRNLLVLGFLEAADGRLFLRHFRRHRIGVFNCSALQLLGRSERGGSLLQGAMISALLLHT